MMCFSEAWLNLNDTDEHVRREEYKLFRSEEPNPVVQFFFFLKLVELNANFNFMFKLQMRLLVIRVTGECDFS